jgi:hypothetical protein
MLLQFQIQLQKPLISIQLMHGSKSANESGSINNTTTKNGGANRSMNG